jgi:hypothetical protein
MTFSGCSDKSTSSTVAVVTATPTHSSQILPYTLLGLSPELGNAEIARYKEQMSAKGYKVTNFFGHVSGETLNGLNAQSLSGQGFSIKDSQSDRRLLTALLGKDGSVGLILCEGAGVPLQQGSETLLSPGAKWSTVREQFGPSIAVDSGELLVFKGPDEWVACRFLKGLLFDLTLAPASRGPTESNARAK